MLVCYLYTIQQSFTKYLTVQLRKQKITTILKLHLDMMKCPTVHHWRDTLSSFHRICEQLQFLTTRSHLRYLLKHLYVCMHAEVCMRGASLCLHLCAHTSRLVDCSSGFCIGTYTHFPKLDCTWAHLSSTGRPQRFWQSWECVVLHSPWVGQSAGLWYSSPKQCDDGHSAWLPLVPCESPPAVVFHLLLLVPVILLSPGNAEKSIHHKQEQWRNQQRPTDMKTFAYKTPLLELLGAKLH